MDIINDLINVLRIAIIPAGVLLRVMFCLIKIMYSEDETSIYKKRIKNVILFGIIAEVILSIKSLIEFYF
ncbi:MAG: mercury transporter [Bacilli bacterium]|nr:mercury transporter [Bacilli bacterium]